MQSQYGWVETFRFKRHTKKCLVRKASSVGRERNNEREKERGRNLLCCSSWRGETSETGKGYPKKINIIIIKMNKTNNKLKLFIDFKRTNTKTNRKREQRGSSGYTEWSITCSQFKTCRRR